MTEHIETSVPFFSWCPREVLRIADNIHRCISADWEMGIFQRLMYAREMRFVWKELLAENRSSGGFLHPVACGSVSSSGPVHEQHRACGRVFNIAFCASRDRIEACKLSEVEAAKRHLLDEATQFRKTADALAANGLRDPDASVGAAAALRLAIVKEAEANRAIAQMRDGDDPLVVRNDRGSRVVRGVATVIGAEMRCIFGKSMTGAVRNLTQVGLNQKATMQEVRTSAERSRNLQLL